jgi:hypothetical protein
MAKLISTEQIARAILVLRGQRVLLDAELAALYGVAAKTLAIMHLTIPWIWI